MTLRLIILLGCLALICACAFRSEPVRLDHYRLDACLSRADSPAGDPGNGPGHGPVIRVAAVRGPASLHDPRIVYRLSYASGRPQSRYAHARWAEPPAQMLTAGLRAHLAREGPWMAVVGPDTDARASYMLSLRVDDLVHVFPAPEDSYALLLASLLVTDDHGRTLAQREVAHRIPAAPNAAGAVRAMNEAARRLCTEAGELLREIHARATAQAQSASSGASLRIVNETASLYPLTSLTTGGWRSRVTLRPVGRLVMPTPVHTRTRARGSEHGFSGGTSA